MTYFENFLRSLSKVHSKSLVRHKYLLKSIIVVLQIIFNNFLNILLCPLPGFWLAHTVLKVEFLSKKWIRMVLGYFTNFENFWHFYLILTKIRNLTFLGYSMVICSIVQWCKTVRNYFKGEIFVFFQAQGWE